MLVQDRDGFFFQPAGILKYVEDLKRGANKDMGPKDYFEMAGSHSLCPPRFLCGVPIKKSENPSPSMK
jgi:hypothetical protein